MRVPKRFLARLNSPSDPAERLRVERVLASARVFLTIAALVAVYLDTTEPSRYAVVAYALLSGYVLYSLVLWVVLQGKPQVESGYRWIHLIDVLIPATFVLFTAGPNSPFFLFFVFTLTAAAFRWGFVETVTTSVGIVAVISLEAVMLGGGPSAWLEGTYEVNRFVIRSSYLLALGLLLGYLGEQEKQWRAESELISRTLSRIRVEAGLRAAMQTLLGEYLRIFGTGDALLALEQAGSGRVFLWTAESLPSGDIRLTSREVEPEDRGRFHNTLPADTLFARRRGTNHWAVWAIGADGSRARPAAEFNPGTLPECASVSSLLAVSVATGPEFSGYLLLRNATIGREPYKELAVAQKLLRQVGPACYTVYLLRRLRLRAGATERARVARELHDGAIQALIAVEMEVDILRRQVSAGTAAGTLPAGLQRVQEMLREQVFDLRMLMQQMKPVELSPEQLLDYLADMVDRFRRDTGITAQFICGLEEVNLPPRTCRELARILQEALVNVRKHSRAHNVLVRFASDPTHWKLVIEDDGRGFDFQGTLNIEQLDSAHRGPGIIKERVRMLGGQLHIHSEPGRGTQLEITLPQKAQIAYV